VFALADVVHFLAPEFSSLRGSGFSFRFVSTWAPDGLFFRHKIECFKKPGQRTQKAAMGYSAYKPGSAERAKG
jgi:hypothetical protein